MNQTFFFVGEFIICQSVLLWWHYNDKKAYRILAVLPFKMSATSLSCLLPWSLASTPWAMSLYIKFRAIHFWLLNEYQWWHQAKIYHIIRQLSYRFISEIMTWSDDKTKLIHNKANLRDLIAATGLVILLKLDSIVDFSTRVTLKFDGWAWKNYRAPLLHHIKLCASFQSHQWILELQSGKAQFG